MEGQEVSAVELEVLQEIGNIGMGNALTSLAQLINQRLEMTVPRACFLPLEEVIKLAGGYEELVSCISLSLLGEAPGTVFYIFNEESTYSLIDLLMGLKQGTNNSLDELSESAVKEVGNVLTGSFISALGQMTGLRMFTSVPLFAFDMLGAVITSLMVAAGHIEDSVLVIETKLFPRRKKQIAGYFFLLAEPCSISRLMSALGISL